MILIKQFYLLNAVSPEANLLWTEIQVNTSALDFEINIIIKMDARNKWRELFNRISIWWSISFCVITLYVISYRVLNEEKPSQKTLKTLLLKVIKSGKII